MTKEPSKEKNIIEYIDYYKDDVGSIEFNAELLKEKILEDRKEQARQMFGEIEKISATQFICSAAGCV